MIWVAENLGLVLVGGLLIATALLVAGALATWRTAKRLRTAPRPYGRLALALLLLVAGLGAVVFCGAGVAVMGPSVWAHRQMLGKPAPELAYSLVASDRPGRLADLRGQVVLVNMWATWCPPCRAEMADLERLQTDYADDGLVVLHLSDEDRETLAAWLEEHPAATLHARSQPIPWIESGRPTTYVVDRQGTIRRILLGQRSYEQFEAEVRRHL